MTVEVDAGGVHRRSRDQFVGCDPQIGGGKPEFAAPLGAVLDRRTKEIVPPQQLSGGPHLAQQHQATDPRAADRRSSAGQRGNDVDGKTMPRAKPAKEGRVAAPAVSEAVFFADDETAQLHPAQQPLHEGRRTQGGELRGEGKNHQVVQADLSQQPGFFVEGGQVRGAMIRIEHTPRVRLERHEDAGGARGLRVGDQRPQQRQVTAMDTVEGTHGGVCGAEEAWCWKAEADRRHDGKTARGCKR